MRIFTLVVVLAILTVLVILVRAPELNATVNAFNESSGFVFRWSAPCVHIAPGHVSDRCKSLEAVKP